MHSLPSDGYSRQSRKRDFYADPARKPDIPPPDRQVIPDELKSESRWVNWALEWRDHGKGGGRWDKVPYQPNGRRARSNDPNTWTSFDEALRAFGRDRSDGIGFMLGDGFVGIDLDDVRNPDTEKFTRTANRIGRLLETYGEVSPSGTGAKLIGRGTWRAG